MDDWLRISTSLTSEPLPCSAPRLFVSRINRTGWLRVKDQCYVVGGKRTLAIPYLSIVRKKRGGEGTGSLQLYPAASTQSSESFLSHSPTLGVETF